MIHIFVGCQWPPKSCTVRTTDFHTPPAFFFLFTFLHNNNDSLSPVENGEKPRSQRLQWSRITWKFGTRREWCDNGGGGTANRSVWSGKWRTGNIKERKGRVRRGNGWLERERQNVRFVLAILCLVLLFGLNVTRDGIELPYVTKLRTIYFRIVIIEDNNISTMIWLEIYKLEF